MAAARPSKHRHKLNTDVELKLLPIMSMMMLMVAMLLQSAVFDKMAAVQLNLPSVDEAITYQPVASASNDQSVSLAITSTGFTLLNSETILKKIQKVGGKYDLDALSSEMSSAKNRFKGQSAIIIMVEDGVIYDDIIHTMDKCRPFFPSVSLAPSIAVGG